MHSRTPASALALLSAVFLGLGGCGGCDPGGTSPGTDAGDGVGARDGGTAPPIPGAVALTIDPLNATLQTDGTTRPTQAFTVSALLDNGDTRDVTDTVGYALTNPALGSVDVGLFTSAAIGGTSDLTANAGALTAIAHITVELAADVTDDTGGALPADPAAPFAGAPLDTTRAPTLVYPNDGVLVPKNLGVLEIHFYPGDGNELFAVRFDSPAMSVRVFTRCRPLNGGCLYVPSEDVWALLRDTNAGQADPIQVRIVGTDDAATGQASSETTAVHVSAADVAGALYYWTTTNKAIMRVDFGARDQTPERFWPVENGGPCYGCHALSPDGTKMSLSQNGQFDGEMTILDVASLDRMLDANQGQREQFQAWDPTSSMFAAIYGDDDPPDTNIRIREGETGNVLETIPVNTEVSHPHWSPDGERIAFTVVTEHFSSQRPGRGGISYVEKQGGSWSTPIELIAPEDGKNRYTPVYAPDASYLVYIESTCEVGETYNRDCDADADDVAKVWAMGVDGANRRAMSNANAAGVRDDDDNLANTFPRWAPFEDPRYQDGSGRVHWLTLSSRRQYGLRDPDGKQLLWMIGFDVDKMAAGEDGSFPPFALPFQDLSTSNHMAQWAEVFVPAIDGGPNPDGGGGGDAGCPPGSEACGGGNPLDGGGSNDCTPIGDPCDLMGLACCGSGQCLTTESGNICLPVGG